jgi:glutamate dehydrogenase
MSVSEKDMGRESTDLASASVGAVMEELRRRATAAEAELVVRFGELYLADATPEFFADRTPATVAALVMSAFRHMAQSSPDRTDVTVSAPEVDIVSWSAPVTLIRTHAAEAPFIVSTIREYLHERQLPVERFLHPVLKVERNADGTVRSVGPGSAGPPLESLVHCEVPRIGDPALIARVRDELSASLDDVEAVTADFAAIMDALNDSAASLEQTAHRLTGREGEIREVRDFLRWLRPNFVFLGYCETGVVRAVDNGGAAEPGARLGLARQPDW